MKLYHFYVYSSFPGFLYDYKKSRIKENVPIPFFFTLLIFPGFIIYRGPAAQQTVTPVEDLENQESEAYGCIGSQNTSHISKLDREILSLLSEKGHKNVSTTRMSWPTRDVKPTNDFSDGTIIL